ncbi:right-handed parallel beta-helix repeat-containing protein [Flindersiella endophytica]
MWGVLVVLISVLVSNAAVPAATYQPPFVVYLAPADAGGSDLNDGLTAERPINTLMRAQGIIALAQPPTDVEVRIKAGVYISQPLWEWRTYLPGRTISFMPDDYQPGDSAAGIRARPIFRNAKCGGKYCEGYWFQLRLPIAPSEDLYDGGTSGLRFYYLQVENYSAGGVSVYGESEREHRDKRYKPAVWRKASKGLNGNTFVGMNFRRLGNKWTRGKFGYGAITLTNSSGNRIVNNSFNEIENAGARGPYIHGVYVTHFSSDNRVERNTFNRNSGDPVKVRDQSNRNVFQGNVFVRSGEQSFYRDEYCDRRCALAYHVVRQCASYGNRFVRNRLVSGYRGGRITPWTLGPGGMTNAGSAPCKLPKGEPRLRTGHNSWG